MAPFGKGGGPEDREIFSSNRYFHKSVTAETLRLRKRPAATGTILRVIFFLSLRLSLLSPGRCLPSRH